MARRRSRSPLELPPALVRLIEAARYADEDAEGVDLSGLPHALHQFGELALWTIPLRGVFVPNNDDVCQIVARAAGLHFGLDEAKRELDRALEILARFEDRDSIASAHGHVTIVSNAAYFYAGLAFGVTLADAS